FGYLDDAETANTQVCLYDYGDCRLLFEVRGLPTKSPYPGKQSPHSGSRFTGNIFYCGDGFLVSHNYTGAMAFSRDGELIQSFSGGHEQDHFNNSIKAVRSRRSEDLTADILEGHLSSALCHLGNISYRLGVPQSFGKPPLLPSDDKQAVTALAQMEEHLKDRGLKLNELTYTLGRRLRLDPSTETFIGDSRANELLTRVYRKGFEMPAKS